jgi:hypothetical protein
MLNLRVSDRTHRTQPVMLAWGLYNVNNFHPRDPSFNLILLGEPQLTRRSVDITGRD